MANPKSAPEVDHKWQTEEDLRTLRRACEVMNDKDRLARVKKLMKEEVSALKKLEDLDGLRRDKY